MNVTVSNTTILNGARDTDSFLYINTENTIRVGFTPNRKATFNPGTLTQWSDDDNFNPTGTIIYLFGLEGLISSGWDWLRIKVDEDWNVSIWQDPQRGGYLGLVPTRRHSLAEGFSLPLTIDGLKIRDIKDQAAATLTFLYYNVDGITEGGSLNHQRAHVSVALREPPDVGPLPALTDDAGYHCRLATADAFGADPDVAWIKTTWPEQTAVPNEFTVDIGPGDGKTPVHAGKRTSLLLSFATADTEFGALASRADLANARVTADEGADGWTVIPHTDEQTPYWKIVIPEGRPLRGRLRFSEVVSHLEPGWSDLLVQYRGVPGYRDGQFTGRLYKYGPPYPSNVSFSIFKPRHDPSSGGYLRYSWDGFQEGHVYFFIAGPRGFLVRADVPYDIPDAGIHTDYVFRSSPQGCEAILRAERGPDSLIYIGSVPVPIIYV
ncbi:hypothetical protein P7L75_00895 (plasmid) [Tistrella mobilis]|uniref:hypothetical protein n=1 Tax=Tistrella mobilis TaxID=171437 RepID=UPI003558C6CE